MYIVGIDFGSVYLKAVLCVLGDDNKEITVLKTFVFDHKSAKKGTLSDMEKAKDVFGRLLEKIKNEFSEPVDMYVISISGENVSSYTGTTTIPLWKQENEERRVKITRSHVKEVINTAKMTAYNKDDKTEIHSVPQEFQIDDQPPTLNPVDMSGIKLKGSVYVIQTDKAHRENLTEILKSVGIDNYRIVFSPLATAESVLDEEDKEGGAIVVSIGDQTTELAVYTSGINRMAKVIPFGSGNITRDLKVVLKTDYRTAEDIKKNEVNVFLKDTDPEKIINIPGSNSVNSDFSEEYVSKIAEARLKEIYEFVMKEVYKGSYQRLIHSPVVITGPGSRIRGAEKLFADMNNSKTVSGTLSAGVKSDFEISDEYYSAIGLVKYAVLNGMLNEDDETENKKGFLKWIKQFISDLV